MKTDVEKIKSTYLPGMRIRLLRMDDIQAPLIGTEGMVRGVEDADQNENGVSIFLKAFLKALA